MNSDPVALASPPAAGRPRAGCRSVATLPPAGCPARVRHGSSRWISLSRLDQPVAAQRQHQRLGGAGRARASISTSGPARPRVARAVVRAPRRSRPRAPSTPATSSISRAPSDRPRSSGRSRRTSARRPMGVVWVRTCPLDLEPGPRHLAPARRRRATSSPDSDPVITASPMCPAITWTCVVGQTCSTSSSSWATPSPETRCLPQRVQLSPSLQQQPFDPGPRRTRHVVDRQPDRRDRPPEGPDVALGPRATGSRSSASAVAAGTAGRRVRRWCGRRSAASVAPPAAPAAHLAAGPARAGPIPPVRWRHAVDGHGSGPDPACSSGDALPSLPRPGPGPSPPSSPSRPPCLREPLRHGVTCRSSRLHQNHRVTASSASRSSPAQARSTQARHLLMTPTPAPSPRLPDPRRPAANPVAEESEYTTSSSGLSAYTTADRSPVRQLRPFPTLAGTLPDLLVLVCRDPHLVA